MRLADALATSMCWCGRVEVEIPVAWIGEQTKACDGPGCGPGCAMVPGPDEASDPYDDDDDYEPRKWKMNKFNPDKYDPRADSTPGLPRRAGSISLLVGTGMCGCGCGNAPTGDKARFQMGHDARLKGKLTRALAARVDVALVEETDGTVTVVSPLEYAARFSTDKVDWTALIQASVDKILERRGRVDRRASERRVLDRAIKDGAVRTGRWDATDSVAAIYRLEDGSFEVEYVDEDGSIKQQKVQVA